MSIEELRMKLAVWALIVIVIAFAKLSRPRRLPTLMGYALVVLSAAALGRYLGLAEATHHLLK